MKIATWIREKDQPLFARFFADSGINVCDARLAPVELDKVGGVLITGGPDIDAQFHNEPVRDASLIEDPEPDRDAWEFAAVRAAIGRGLPLLCICKGVQVLNLALGGTLHLDINGHDLPELRDGNLQTLRFDKNARHRFEKVNSSHHQALDRVADALEIEAWSAADGVVEQVRLRNYPFGIGVQYHPERDMCYAPLFEEFVAQLKR